MSQPSPIDSSRRVGEVMSSPVLEVRPEATLREAARQMARRRLGAAVVPLPDNDSLSIITERDLLVSLGAGEDPDPQKVGSHATRNVVFASPSWSIEEAAVTMIHGDFRHLGVIDGSEAVGVLSLRNVVRVWTQDGESVELPPTVSRRRAE
jgi:signal-transduction protein with cAMP-binding, CBS, and nucleotidyltransferase domain